MRLWLALGALNGLVAVIMGAMTGHAGALEEAAQATAQTAVRYQFWHALALLALASLAERPGARPWLVTLAGTSFYARLLVVCRATLSSCFEWLGGVNFRCPYRRACLHSRLGELACSRNGLATPKLIAPARYRSFTRYRFFIGIAKLTKELNSMYGLVRL